MPFKALWKKFKFKSFRSLESNVDIKNCLNCNTALDTNTYFCPNCGQQKHVSKITVWTLLGEFFTGLFNIESGIYKSALRIFYPAYLSKEFIRGRRKAYLNPIRFFLIALIAQFALLSTTYDLNDLDNATQRDIKKVREQELAKKFELWADSLYNPALDRCPIDSIHKFLFDTSKVNIIDLSGINVKIMGVDLEKYQIKKVDIYELPLAELLIKYKVEKGLETLVISQIVRTVKDLGGAFRFAIGNVIWSIIFAIFVTGLFMKLLYIRRKHYYVEHVILLFDIHTFAFIAVSLSILFAHWFNQSWNEGIAKYPYALSALFFFLSIKKYYNQGWFKSIIKYLMVLFFYAIVLGFMIVIVFLVSLLFYR